MTALRPVRIDESPSGYRLLRGEEEYFIRGAGGRVHLELVPAAGGNSVRTWHDHEAGPRLDEAMALGLTVTVGIWLPHERHGFRYDDDAVIRLLKESAQALVESYRNHPALLIWAVGNEMEGDGTNERIWRVVNEIARMVKRIDPLHPTMTVTADVNETKVEALNALCPDVDILGVNTYGMITSLPERLARCGWRKPFVVTEFGPRGWWEVERTDWGAELEPTSTEKARFYLEGYRRAIEGCPGKCLGSYVFTWGHKQEHTETWFGMFLKDGRRVAAVDAMERAWTGRWPARRCPEIVSIDSSAFARSVPAGSRQSARIVSDGAVEIEWHVRAESGDKKEGGDRETEPEMMSSGQVAAEDGKIFFRAPERRGPYRIFLVAHDGAGYAATANIPFYSE